MKRLLFYLRYALRSLRREGMRSFLAVLSVAFGILSLIAMQLLANALFYSSMFDQRAQFGGDAQISPADFSSAFTATDIAQMDTWLQDGLISDYTAYSNGSSMYLATPDNARVSIIIRALGIDPTTYPLVGELLLREPAGATPADVLQNPTDVLVTRDLAEERGLQLGDSVLLSSESTPIRLTVAGIISATPSQLGDSVFYSLETARLIENTQDVINTISLNWGTAPNADQIIIDSPYYVFVALDRDGAIESSSGVAIFDIMLKGAGVLGLLIGGISVSNTLQVILARRKLEIAMLKTLGYGRGDLLVLISLETGIIGLVGGIVGALLGTLVATKLLDVLAGAGSLMLSWQPHPVIILGGIAIGILTGIVFGMQAILASSATRPVQLLRDLPLKISRATQAGRIALYLAMLVVFGVLVGIVLGTPLEGVLYVIVGGIAIVILRVIFWIVLWAMLKLPLPRFPMLRLARANLRQRKMQASLAVMALFAGAFSVTFAALVIFNAQSTVTRLRGSDEGYNLMVYTTDAGVDDAVNHMITQGAVATYFTQRVRGTMNGESVLIEGREMADFNKDMQYSGDWSETENLALLPDYQSEPYQVGDTLRLNVNGQEQVVTVAGFYIVDWQSLSRSGSVIVSPRVLQGFTGIEFQTLVFGNFPVLSLGEVTNTLGSRLPNTLVFSLADINDAMVSTYRALFMFAASVAGLAFVAGAVLIANSAGLTVVERYREIGIFKAVGYTSGHVLRSLLSEYGFLGVIAGVFGVAGAVVAIIVISLMFGARLSIEPTILVIMLLFSVSIAVVSAAVVAWQPTRVRPLDVLRYE